MNKGNGVLAEQNRKYQLMVQSYAEQAPDFDMPKVKLSLIGMSRYRLFKRMFCCKFLLEKVKASSIRSQSQALYHMQKDIIGHMAFAQKGVKNDYKFFTSCEKENLFVSCNADNIQLQVNNLALSHKRTHTHTNFALQYFKL